MFTVRRTPEEEEVMHVNDDSAERNGEKGALRSSCVACIQSKVKCDIDDHHFPCSRFALASRSRIHILTCILSSWLLCSTVLPSLTHRPHSATFLLGVYFSHAHSHCRSRTATAFLTRTSLVAGVLVACSCVLSQARGTTMTPSMLMTLARAPAGQSPLPHADKQRRPPMLLETAGVLRWLRQNWMLTWLIYSTGV